MKKDYNSVINQRIKSKFVNREIYACQSMLIEECFQKGVLSSDDIENLLHVAIDRFNKLKDALENALYKGNLTEEAREKIETRIDELSGDIESLESDTQQQEIYEWWLVSHWLFDKLKEKGEPVLNYANNYWWGRGVSGQAILLDAVISEICWDMEILHGQENEWKV